MGERIFSWSFRHSFNRNLVLNQRNRWHIDGSKMKNQSTGKTSISFCKAFNSCLTFAFLIHFEDSGVLYFHSNREITSFLVTSNTSSLFPLLKLKSLKQLWRLSMWSLYHLPQLSVETCNSKAGKTARHQRPHGANPRGFWSASG